MQDYFYIEINQQKSWIKKFNDSRIFWTEKLVETIPFVSVLDYQFPGNSITEFIARF